MRRCSRIMILSCVFLLVLGGCASLNADKSAEPAAAKSNEKSADKSAEKPKAKQDLASGYSLLYDLLKSEQDVAKILSIKSVSKPTDKLIRAIAATSAEGVKELDKLGKLSPTLAYSNENLPLVEKATRKSIAFKTGTELIFTFDSIEINLILTQTQATRYGQFLAEELADVDPNKERVKWLKSFAKKYEKHYDDLLTRLQVAK